MSTRNPDPMMSEKKLVFGAELAPHRSLAPQGFLLLMGSIGLISFAAGIAFYLAGAWPVVGFLGLDVLLVYLAFRINYRRGNLREILELTRDDLHVRRIDHRGRETSWHFQPYWLQVNIDEPPDHHSQLLLSSHGRSLAVGSFLAPEERLDLAQALRRALGEIRCLPHPV